MKNRLSFWQSLEQEIVAAKNLSCMVLLQMDANAKVGNTCIPGDPNQMSANGRLLVDLISRENLVLVNSSAVCSGVITRHRVTQEKVEKSILDSLIVCDKLEQYLEMMIIDEERNFPLTKYASKKGSKRIVQSDHNTMYGRFSIEYISVKWKRPREEVFNLKNTECQQKFSDVTNDSYKLKNCFTQDMSFEDQCNQFFKTFDDLLHQCFRRIRLGGSKNPKS